MGDAAGADAGAYVDASAPPRSAITRRAPWSAPPALVELFLASLALFLWCCRPSSGKRVPRASQRDTAGVSTVTFVGSNPAPQVRRLLTIPGSDLLQIPNLRQRGQRYLTCP